MHTRLRILCAVMFSWVCVIWTLQAQEQKEILGRTKAEWLKILASDEKARMRKGAVIALGLYGPEQTDVLAAHKKALMTDKDEQVRNQVLVVWGRLSEKTLLSEVPTIAAVMKFDKSSLVRGSAAKLLGQLGKDAKPALNLLIELLKDEDPIVRSSSAETIGRMGQEGKEALKPMLPLMKDKDANVRFNAIFAIARFGPEAAIALPDIGERLEKDESEDVRREAARSIGLFGPGAKTARDSLIKALRSDTSAEVRQQIALTLGKMQAEIEPVAKEIKEVIRTDKDKTVRDYLIRSMSSALGKNFKEHVKDFAAILMQEADGDVRVTIIQELASLGMDAMEALPALQQCLGDVQVIVRDTARDAIKRITQKKVDKK